MNSLLVHRNINACMLISYPAALDINFGVEFFGFLCRRSCYLKIMIILFLFSCTYPFISSCCLIGLANVSNTILNRNGDSGLLCCVPDILFYLTLFYTFFKIGSRCVVQTGLDFTGFPTLALNTQ